MPGVYPISATDSTRPQDNDDAQYAAAELRTLKAYVATLTTVAAANSAAQSAASAAAALVQANTALAAAALLGANTLIQYCGLAVGTANAIIIYPPTTVALLVEGQEFTFTAAFTTSSTTPTLQVGTLTPVNLSIPVGGIAAGEQYKALVRPGLTTAKISRIIPTTPITPLYSEFIAKQFFPTF